MSRDPYDVLGVSRSASHDDIRAAYRKLAKQYHPDRNPNDKQAEDRFKQINAAFDIVGDEETRKKFDRGEIDADGRERANPFWGQAGGAGGGGRGGFSGQPGGGTYHFESGGDFGGVDDLGDILSGIFGQGFNRGGQRDFRTGGAGPGGSPFQSRGQDIQYKLTIDFLEMANGATKRIELSDGGSRLDVRIPSGIEDGQTLRLKGKGLQGIGGGPAGDALVEIKVRDHPYFKRDGNNVTVDLPISLDEAVLGGKVNVPTISGNVALTIPKGASSGKVLRLKEKGIYDQRASTRGDQLVRLMITLPDSGNDDLADFLSNRTAAPFNPRKSFDDK